MFMLYNYLKFVLIIVSVVFIFENKALKFSAIKSFTRLMNV